MKQFFFGLVACGLVAVLPAQAMSVAAAKVADAAPPNTDQTGSAPAANNDPLSTDQKDSAPAATSDPSLCLDSMETVPDDDDLALLPVSVDGGCSVSQDTIST
jgi:hypothetical protein